MARLLLGPVLRHVGQRDATVWVETDGPCTVQVLGCRAPTFKVAGHHYALVRIDGLSPGGVHEYTVELDGDQVWPERSDYPPSVIRTFTDGSPVRLLFGSCRIARPHTPPYTLSPDQREEGRGVDVLTAWAEHLRHQIPDALPDLVLHLGDQVYSDRLSAPVLAFVSSRRSVVAGPPNEVVDFEEFAQLYRDAWSDPSLRWLLSTVPNAMIFDDHDVHDDWNTSLAWRQQQDRLPWWHGRMVAALMTYWIYQHAGNLDLDALAEEGLLDRLEQQREDATQVLRTFAEQAHRHPEGYRWSYRRQLGPAQLVVVDSRAGRVLEPHRRDILDAAGWTWLEEQLQRAAKHHIVASTLPILLPRPLHDLEAWNERVCDGAWGQRAAAAGEQLRQYLDLEHWAAFGRSFQHLMDLLRQTSIPSSERRPATINLLGGDVHFGYVAELEQPPDTVPIHQLVCSPLRNQLDHTMKLALRASLSRGARLVTSRLVDSANVPSPPLHWRVIHGPWFHNHLAELRLADTRATLAVREGSTGRHPELQMRLLLRLDRGL